MCVVFRMYFNCICNELKLDFYVRAAAEDDVDSLYAWHLAGANFFLTDHENRTAIQVVCSVCVHMAHYTQEHTDTLVYTHKQHTRTHYITNT